MNTVDEDLQPEPLQTALLGSWRLESWVLQLIAQEPAETRAHHPFGEYPAGLLMYSSDGWMSATVHRGQRAEFPVEMSPRQLPEKQLAEAFTSYFHYAGTWRIEDQNVIHSVRHALNPNMVGTEQVRNVDLSGDTLVLTGIEDLNNAQRRHVLNWRRLAQPADS